MIKTRSIWMILCLLLAVLPVLVLSQWENAFTYTLAFLFFVMPIGMLAMGNALNEHDTLTQWGIAFVLGSGIAGTTAILVRVSPLPIEAAYWLLWAVALLFGVAFPGWLNIPQMNRRQIKAGNAVVFVIGLLLVLSISGLRPVFDPTPVDADRPRDEWVYAATIQQALLYPDELYPSKEVLGTTEQISRRLVVNGWTQLQATITGVLGFGTELPAFSGVQALIVLMAMVSSYALGRLLFDNAVLGVVAAVTFGLYHISRLVLFPGSALMWQHDKFVAIIALSNFAVVAALLYLQKPHWQRLLLLMFIVWTLTSFHVFALVVYGVTMGCVWLAHYHIRAYKWQALTHFALMLLAAAPAIVFALWQRQAIPSYVFTLADGTNDIALRHLQETSWGWMVSNRYFTDLPTLLVLGSGIVFGLLSIKTIAGRYTLFLTLGILALTKTPLTVLMISLTSTVQIIRLYWIVPAGMAFACVVYVIVAVVPSQWRRVANPVTATAMMIAGVVFVLSYGAVDAIRSSWGQNTPLDDNDRWLLSTIDALPEAEPIIFTVTERPRMLIYGSTKAKIVSYYMRLWSPELTAQYEALRDGDLSDGTSLFLMSRLPISDEMKSIYPNLDLPDVIEYNLDYLLLHVDDPLYPYIAVAPDTFAAFATNGTYTLFQPQFDLDWELGWREALLALGEALIASEQHREVGITYLSSLAEEIYYSAMTQVARTREIAQSGDVCMAQVYLSRAYYMREVDSDFMEDALNTVIESDAMRRDVALDTRHDECFRLYTQTTAPNSGSEQFPDNADGERGLFFYRPEQATPTPVVVIVHGGGWASRLTIPPASYTQIQAYREAGFTVVAPQYRVLPATYQESVNDLACLFGYLEENAVDLGIDPTQISVIATSSGAAATALLITQPPTETDCGYSGNTLDIKSAVLIAGIYDFPLFIANGDNATDERLIENLTSWAVGDVVSPAQFTPQIPILLLHGTDDDIISPQQSQIWYDRLQETNPAAELVLMNALNHIMMERIFPEWTAASVVDTDRAARQQLILDFLRQ